MGGVRENFWVGWGRTKVVRNQASTVCFTVFRSERGPNSKEGIAPACLKRGVQNNVNRLKMTSHLVLGGEGLGAWGLVRAEVGEKINEVKN